MGIPVWSHGRDGSEVPSARDGAPAASRSVATPARTDASPMLALHDADGKQCVILNHRWQFSGDSKFLSIHRMFWDSDEGTQVPRTAVFNSPISLSRRTCPRWHGDPDTSLSPGVCGSPYSASDSDCPGIANGDLGVIADGGPSLALGDADQKMRAVLGVPPDGSPRRSPRRAVPRLRRNEACCLQGMLGYETGAVRLRRRKRTIVFGDESCGPVLVLRAFRDTYLADRDWGRVVIRTYGRVGPILARLIDPHEWVKRILRGFLAALADRIRRWRPPRSA